MNKDVAKALKNYDVFPIEDLTSIRAPHNTLENEGVLFVASRWIVNNLITDDDIKDVYDNFHGYRSGVGGGSFDLDDNYKIYGEEERFEISHAVLNGDCVYLIVLDTKQDKYVAAIRIN